MNKLVIIGMDGLDPVLLKEGMEAGKLPNFKALAESGTFSDLQTSNPPQSPVAWSNFISGHNPGHHDVFDFISRDPKTYLPEIGMTQTKKNDKPSLGQLLKGMGGPNVQTRRKGKSFWDYLAEKNIPSVVLRCPVTFPAEKMNGSLISGMGTPDLKGTQGVFFYFTTKEISGKDIQGRVQQVYWDGGRIETKITGPKVRTKDGLQEIAVPIFVEKKSDTRIGIDIQGQKQEIGVGEWSDWFRLKFKVGTFNSVTGIVRFHLNSMEPEFALYGSPVNIDPQDPAMPISHPADYSKKVFEKIGPYYTQGMPYDTWALNEGRIDEKTFLELAYEIQDENLKHLRLELNTFKSGFLFCYFGITDLISHMFWRYRDPKHPNKGESNDPKVRNAIEDVYVHMDGVLGEIRKSLPEDTTLLVISDHGFGSFRRAVHVNSWLREKGLLVLLDEEEGTELFGNVDWSETRAYSLGFGGIYINQFGREKSGIVYKGKETEDLKEGLIKDLKEWKDANGESVVHTVYRGEDLYSGDFKANGPDLFIGFDKGYRASWQTALGAAPLKLIEDNMKKWGGDHLCEPSLVPGVLLSNKPLTSVPNPSLLDLAPTVLSFFGLPVDQNLEGRSLLNQGT